MSARSLLTFAQMHLEDGKAADGTQVLASGTPAAMQDRQVELPYLGHLGTSWGLGFERFDAPSGALVGHDGNTIGQSAFLRIVPDAGVAVALLTNGGNAGLVFRDVVGHALRELTDRSLPDEPLPPSDPPPIDASPYVGTYANSSVTLEVSQEDDGTVWVNVIPTDDLSKELGEQPQRWELVQYAGDTLITRERETGLHRLLAFLDRDAGHAAYVHTGRAHARADS